MTFAEVRDFILNSPKNPVPLPPAMYEWFKQWCAERCVYPASVEMPKGVINVCVGGRIRHVVSEKP